MNKRKVPKIRFKGFYDDWEQRKLADVSESYSGGTPSVDNKSYYGGSIPFIRSAEINSESTELFLTEEGLSYSSARMVSKGDILYALYGATSGEAGRSHINGAINQAILAILPHDGYDSEFLMQWFRKSKQNIIDVYLQGGQGNLSGAIVKALEVNFPSLAEQRQIGNYFQSLDYLITLHQRKLELLKRLRNSLVDRCFIGEKCTMSKLILYHGSPNRVIVPKFGFGEDRHDYGRGFYLTESLELAKEWAVCRPDETNGWVHKYELEMEGLNILDFQKYDVLSWLAELMKHRDAADSRRYKMLAQKFIEKYGIDTCGYDVITGWRANASYFYIAKEFVRDNIDIEILEELLSLGGLGIQFCIKSERAFAQLSEVEQDIMSVDYSEFNDRYNSGTTICRAARS